MLKPQDLVVLLKVHNLKTQWTYSQLAQSLGMSSSEVHAALKRCETSGLYQGESRKVLKQALGEFLVHGLKYVFPGQPGAIVRGLPTAHSAEPLKSLLMVNADDVYVWAFPHGEVRGQAIQPLYPCVPQAAINDSQLYELLCLIDALRVGRIREQKLAASELLKRLNQ
jgi:DNA-binding Lrp family transcriptional regulator